MMETSNVKSLSSGAAVPEAAEGGGVPTQQQGPSTAAAAAAAAGAPADADAASTSQTTFPLLGKLVSIKGFGKARVLTAPLTEGPFKGRCKVERVSGGKATGEQRHIYPRQLHLLREPPSNVLVVETTREYREAAFQFTDPEDIVLEVGCHFGVTAFSLYERAAFVVGVDKSEDNVAEARRRYPAVRFEAMDGFDLERLKSLSPRHQQSNRHHSVDNPGNSPGDTSSSGGGGVDQQQQQQQGEGEGAAEEGEGAAANPHVPAGPRRRPKHHALPVPPPAFTKVFLDVGGIAELHTVAALVGLYHRAFRGAVLVIKSKYLKTLLRHATVWEPYKEAPFVQHQEQEDEEEGKQQQKGPAAAGSREQLGGGSSKQPAELEGAV